MMNLAAGSPLWVHTAVEFLLGVAFKAAVLGVLAYAIHLVLGRRRVLVRSVLWNGCVAGLLILPLVVLWIPSLRIVCLPADRSEARAPAIVIEGLRPSRPQPLPANEPSVRESPRLAALPTPAPRVPERSVPITPQPRRKPVDPLLAVLCVYAIGVAGLTVRLVLSLCAVGRLRRSVTSVDNEAWNESLERWRGRLAIRRRIRLVQSDLANVPLAVGWLRPTIVLPSRLVETSVPKAVDAIALHELAHVRRGDYSWNLLLRLVQVVYWPHPVAWLIGKVVGAVREQACDDLCIYLTEDAMSYRLILLEVAAGMVRRPREALGLTMARSSKLRRRIRDIESSEGAARCLLRGPARVVIVLIAIGVAGVAGSMRLARIASAQTAEPAKKSGEPASAEKPADVEPRAEEAAKKPRVSAAEVKKLNARSAFHFEAVKLQRGDLKIEAAETARLEFAENADVNPPARSGVVSEVLVGIGESVKKGDVLARITGTASPADRSRAELVTRQAASKQDQARAQIAVAEANVEGAEAKVVQAKTELDEAAATVESRKKTETRQLTMVKRNVISQAEADEASDARRSAEAARAGAEAKVTLAKSEVTKARAELTVAKAAFSAAADAHKLARVDLGQFDAPARIDVVAPIDGIITQRNASVGRPVSAGDQTRPLFVVSQIDPMRVTTQVPESEAMLVDRGDPVTLRLPGRSQPLQSVVSGVGFMLDPRFRRLNVEFTVPNTGRKLLAGMRGHASIVLETRRDVLLMPAAAIVSYSANTTCQCIRVEEGKAFPATVTLAGDETPNKVYKSAPAGVARLVAEGGSAYVEVAGGLKAGDSVLILKRVDGMGGNAELRDIEFEPGQPIDTIRIPENLMMQ